MTYFLLLLIIGGGFLFYFTRHKKNLKNDSYVRQESQEKPAPAFPQVKSETKSSTLKKDPTLQVYTKKGLKEFNIVGANHYGLDQEEYEYPTPFFGTVKCEPGQKLGVFRDDGRQIAQVPKGNIKLYNSLTQKHKGENILWGQIYYNSHDKKWQGRATTPVGYSQEEMLRIKKVFALKSLNQEEMAIKQKTSEDYLNVLERHSVIVEEMNALKIQLPYEFPVRFISSATKHFEEDKNWAALIEIEKYTDLIDELSDTYKNATMRRIELAKSNVQ